MLTRPLMAHFSLSKAVFWIQPACPWGYVLQSDWLGACSTHSFSLRQSLSVFPFLISLSYFFFVSDKIFKYTEVEVNCYSLLKNNLADELDTASALSL